MTSTTHRIASARSSAPPGATAAPPAPSGRAVRLAVVTVTSAVVAVVAWLLPAWPAGADMGSTHYMGLLAANQPWNLLLFMAVPVVLAETVAVTELVVLLGRDHPRVELVNAVAGLLAGFWFLGVTSYLLHHAVVPLTLHGGWRGPADLVAVGFYLLGVVPLFGMTLLETGVVGSALDDRARRRVHATLVGVFLVVAHVAMIFGMLDPGVLGWQPTHVMPGGATMPGMTMP